MSSRAVSLPHQAHLPASARADAETFQFFAEQTVTGWHEHLAGLHAGRLAASHVSRDLLEPACQAFLSSGKRLRPLLASWTWRTVTGSWLETDAMPEVVQSIGTATEMLHAASLVIDDIQDGSLERRGRPSLHATCGVPMAINVANWIYFEALGLLSRAGAEPGGPRAASGGLLQRALAMMSHCHMGQALDMAASRRDTMASLVDASAKEAAAFYAATIRFKTAELMGFAVDAVAQCLGLPRAPEPRRGQITAGHVARSIGHLYQQADDLRNMSVSLSASKAHEDFHSLRNQVAIKMLQQMDLRARAELMHQKDAGQLASWMRQQHAFRPALAATCDEVAAGITEIDTEAEACGSACRDYLRATLLDPIQAIVDQVRCETSSNP